MGRPICITYRLSSTTRSHLWLKKQVRQSRPIPALHITSPTLQVVALDGVGCTHETASGEHWTDRCFVSTSWQYSRMNRNRLAPRLATPIGRTRRQGQQKPLRTLPPVSRGTAQLTKELQELENSTIKDNSARKPLLPFQPQYDARVWTTRLENMTAQAARNSAHRLQLAQLREAQIKEAQERRGEQQ